MLSPNSISPQVRAEFNIEKLWLLWGLNMITGQQRLDKMNEYLDQLGEVDKEILTYLEEEIKNTGATRLRLIKDKVINPLTGVIDVKS